MPVKSRRGRLRPPGRIERIVGVKNVLRDQISRVLTRIKTGDDRAIDELFPLVYRELRRQAVHLLRPERAGHTLQATALVNEACVKLAEQTGLEPNNEVHLRAISARAMRQILWDHARARRAKKRGGNDYQVASNEQMDSPTKARGTDLLEFEDVLQALQRLDERKGQVAELKLFGELTHQQVGEALGISPKPGLFMNTVARVRRRPAGKAPDWLRPEAGALTR